MLMWKEGWGLSEGQKRRSSLAPVIGLGPRLSFLRDQSPRSCLPPDCWTNQLSCRPLISHRRLSVAKTISAETPVVVAEQRVWHVCVYGMDFTVSSRSFRLLRLKRDQDWRAWGGSDQHLHPPVHRSLYVSTFPHFLYFCWRWYRA